MRALENGSCYIDFESCMKRLKGNVSLCKKLLELFIKCGEIERLEKVLAEGDAKEAELAAHSLKGIAGNLSMHSLFEESEIMLEKIRLGKCCVHSLAHYKSVFERTWEAAGECLQNLP
jgi:HPt (histidine-containing phosphotransfer) domain-containing protein